MLRGQDAWRQHAVFQNLWKHAFPGFKYGVAAFGVYCAAEFAYDVLTKPAQMPHFAHKPAEHAGSCVIHVTFVSA